MIEKNSITCFVVDDDIIDRLTTLSFLQKHPSIQVIGEFSNAIDALNAAKHNSPDVLFLDIDMPQLNGMQLREQLMNIKACVFITNFPEYAFESFELEAFDFLLKPITLERFNKMATRLIHYFEIKNKAELLSHTLTNDTIFIKEGTNQIKLQLYDVFYLEAMKDYTGFVTNAKKYMVLESISNLTSKKLFANFIRIHRSYAVQKHFVKQYNSTEVILINNIALPVGRSFKETLKTLIE